MTSNDGSAKAATFVTSAHLCDFVAPMDYGNRIDRIVQEGDNQQREGPIWPRCPLAVRLRGGVNEYGWQYHTIELQGVELLNNQASIVLAHLETKGGF